MHFRYFSIPAILLYVASMVSCKGPVGSTSPDWSGNPVIQGWYADPEAVIYGDRYWIYPTYSDAYEKQVHFDCFSSPDGSMVKEITPEGYVEGPVMFIREGKYYFMWSEGGWTGPDYRVAYAIADNPFGPFSRIGTILQQDSTVATGAGHHSLLNIPGSDDWVIVYHRRPLGEASPHHRVTCIDRMAFDDQGHILPVKITFEGVTPRPLKTSAGN